MEGISFEDDKKKTESHAEVNVVDHMMKQRGSVKTGGNEVYKPPKESIRDHQELLVTLNRYHTSRFQGYLSKMGFQLGPGHLRKLDLDELEEMLARIRASLNSKSSSNLFTQGVYGSLQAVELLSMKYYGDKIRLRGWTESLKGDDSFNELLEIIQLEYSNLTSAPPHIRLIYSLVVSGIRTHQINFFLAQRSAVIRESQEEREDEEKEKEKDIAVEENDTDNVKK